MILFPSVALLPNFWYNLTQDKTLIAAPDAPGNSSTKTQKNSTKKGYPQQPPLFFTSAGSLLNIKLTYVLLGPVHPLGRKLLRSYLLVKKLQMAVVAVTVVQPPLARTGT